VYLILRYGFQHVAGRSRGTPYVTKSGLKLFDAAAESRNAWLARVIASEVSAKELPALAKAIDLLERLAASDEGVD